MFKYIHATTKNLTTVQAGKPHLKNTKQSTAISHQQVQKQENLDVVPSKAVARNHRSTVDSSASEVKTTVGHTLALSTCIEMTRASLSQPRPQVYSPPLEISLQTCFCGPSERIEPWKIHSNSRNFRFFLIPRDYYDT